MSTCMMGRIIAVMSTVTGTNDCHTLSPYGGQWLCFWPLLESKTYIRVFKCLSNWLFYYYGYSSCTLRHFSHDSIIYKGKHILYQLDHITSCDWINYSRKLPLCNFFILHWRRTNWDVISFSHTTILWVQMIINNHDRVDWLGFSSIAPEYLDLWLCSWDM